MHYENTIFSLVKLGTVNKEQTSILSLVKAHATKVLTKDLPDVMSYHSLTHTEDVVKAALDIGSNSEFSAEEMETLEIAAWFHDLGYTRSTENHEELGAKMADEFLSELNFPRKKIEQVRGCILATTMPQNPKTTMEEVLCDADLCHIAGDDYAEKAERLQAELSAIKGVEITDDQWCSMNEEFIAKHQFFTQYAREEFGDKVKENLTKIKARLMSMSEEDQKVQELEKEVAKLKAKVKKAKDNTPTRGIETMFRLTSKNHLELSAMADTKANIMISVNSIILSVLVSVLFRKLEEYPHLILPAMIMTLVCLATIVFAILATRPNISKGTFTDNDIMNKKTNLLFFGNFHRMKIDKYEWGMKEMMKDADYLYSSLIKDIYFLGVVLGKKYRLLRISYTIFMFGFVLAVISFGLAEVYLKGPSPY